MLPSSLALQLLVAFLAQMLVFSKGKQAVLVLFELLQGLLLVWASVSVWKTMQTNFVSFSLLVQVYLSFIVGFMGFYSLVYLFTTSSFNVSASSFGGTPTSAFGVFSLFLYFSISTMSSAGLGDVVPTLFASQLLSMIQMIAAVTFYSAIFALAISHRRSSGRQSHSIQEDEVVDMVKAWLVKFPQLSKAISVFKDWLFLATVGIQCFTLALLVIVHNSNIHNTSPVAEVFVAIFVSFIQFFLFVFVLWLSLRIVHLFGTEHVSALFLAQSYLATLVYFAGIYFTIVLLSGRSAFVLSQDTNILSESSFAIIWKLLYFSVSCQTSTGMGDIFPVTGVARFFVSCQMLVTVLYSVMILGLGITQIFENMSIKFQKYAFSPGKMHLKLNDTEDAEEVEMFSIENETDALGG